MKLEIELVPKTSFFKNVRSEVSGGEWDLIRRECYHNAEYRCEICGGVGKNHPVECHEIWEYDDAKYVQKLTGFIALCPDCHQVKHIGLARIKGNYKKALRHLMKVNNIPLAKAKKVVKEAFSTWENRSVKPWELDLSLIKKEKV